MAVAFVPLVESSIRKRADTDRQMSFGAYIIWSIVLSIFTFVIGAVIYWFVIIYQLVERRNQHFERQRELFRSAIRCLREQAETKNDDRLRAAADRAQAMLNDAQLREGEHNAWLWAVILPILTLGLAGFYTLWFLTVDYRRHWERQRELIDAISEGLRIAAGRNITLVDESVVPNRNFWVYLLLSIVTFAIFTIYWTYVLFDDPNKHFTRQAFLEDELVSYLRTLD